MLAALMGSMDDCIIVSPAPRLRSGILIETFGAGDVFYNNNHPRAASAKMDLLHSSGRKRQRLEFQSWQSHTRTQYIQYRHPVTSSCMTVGDTWRPLDTCSDGAISFGITNV